MKRAAASKAVRKHLITPKSVELGTFNDTFAPEHRTGTVTPATRAGFAVPSQGARSQGGRL